MIVHILQHEPELRSWLRHHFRSVNSADIDDLVQEVFARIWALEDLSNIRNGRAYLYATLQHLLVEKVRRSRIVSIETLGDVDSLNVIDGSPGPERRVSASQEVERLRRIVAELPQQCRRVFELRKFHGLSQRDIAQLMGLSEKTIENYIARALTRILASLTNEEEAGDLRRAASSREKLGRLKIKG